MKGRLESKIKEHGCTKRNYLEIEILINSFIPKEKEIGNSPCTRSHGQLDFA